MSSSEIIEFERSPYFHSAVRLRKWDDRAKVEGLETAPLASYRALLEEVKKTVPQ
jgi:predicted HD phosphohydrolase